MIDYKMLPSELVQSIVPNCSVVASVIVCWNHHLRHNSKVSVLRTLGLTINPRAILVDAVQTLSPVFPQHPTIFT